MIDVTAAAEIARAEILKEHVKGMEIDPVPTRELQEGWYFAYRLPEGVRMGGGNGLIVNKRTGRVFHLGSAFGLERDLTAYDAGYQFHAADLVILTVTNVASAVELLAELDINVVEPSYRRGVVWRIPRSLTKDELRARLGSLPAVFGAMPIYARFEALEKLKKSRFLTVELLEYRPIP